MNRISSESGSALKSPTMTGGKQASVMGASSAIASASAFTCSCRTCPSCGFQLRCVQKKGKTPNGASISAKTTERLSFVPPFGSGIVRDDLIGQRERMALPTGAPWSSDARPNASS